MKFSEVQDILQQLIEYEDNADVLGISVNENNITVCYEDKDRNIKVYKTNYKNCDLY